MKAFIAVVKCDHDGFFRQGGAVLDIVDQILNHNRRVAAIFEILHIHTKFIWGDGELIQAPRFLEHMMIHDDWQFNAIRSSRICGNAACKMRGDASCRDGKGKRDGQQQLINDFHAHFLPV